MPRSPTPEPHRTARLRGMVLAGLAAGVIVAGGWALLGVIELRAQDDRSDVVAPAPLPVRTEPLSVVDSYDVTDVFAGLTVPARRTDLAFERAGLVSEITVEDGDRVARGAVLARLDVRDVNIERNRLEAERTTLEADRALARRTLDRRTQLKAEGFETGQGYDQALYALNAIEGRISAVEARLEATALTLEKSALTAPFDGTVSARMLDEGAVVAPGTPLLRLIETGRPQAEIGLPAELARLLEHGETVSLEHAGRTVAGRTVAGRVAAVSPDIEPGTRTVAVLIDIAPAADVPMGAVVRLARSRRIAERGAWVPLGALTEGTEGLWSLYTVELTEDGPVARRAAVELLHVEGGRAFVRGSFAETARAVTEGVHRLTDGRRVAPLSAGDGAPATAAG